eukprot:TRINITY_DN2554_c0_g1_i3.p1 TRINITY_DN2554_c0_g1~~TRINITY_DN2554_c0_g1_i3.p1  ORF type:complete len:584 (-),score=28.34 TRINITY_DN2554_c0_g1_i3:92-1813(-)
MAVATLLYWVSVLRYVPIEPRCLITSRLLHSDHVEQDPTGEVVLSIIVTSCTASAVALFIAHPHLYDAGSRLQFWAKCYTYMSFALVFVVSVDITIGCSSWTLPSWFRVPLQMASLVLFVLNHAMMVWCAFLKLRCLAVVAPIVVRIGEMSGKLLFVLHPLISINFVFGQTAFLRYSRQGLGLVWMFTTMFFYSIVVLVLSFSAKSALNEASYADVDDESASALRNAARWTRIAMIVTTVSGITSSLIPGFRLIGAFGGETQTPLRIYRVVTHLDVVHNVFASLLSGLGDSLGNHRSTYHLDNVVASVHAQRRREIEERLSKAVRASTGSAVTIAALMDGANPNDILREAVSRFRCVSWETLRQRPDIIIAGRPLDGVRPSRNDLYSLSQPCQFGDCDGFFSHSWRDDGEQKWEALRSWCERFLRLEGRYPRLWLDKVCLNQLDFATDLQCLPVFLAACNTIIVASGPTYPSRMWCCMELLVHRAMIVNDPSRRLPELLLFPDGAEYLERQRLTWAEFCVGNCDCFDQEDKRRFLGIVNRYPGGSEGLNTFIRNMFADLLQSPKGSYDFNERI